MSQQEFKKRLQASYQEGWVAGMHRKCARCGARIPVFTEAAEEGDQPSLVDAIDHRCVIVDKLRKALDEIGTTAASVLDEENIRTWDEGGRLGDALIGIKDIVATFYIEEKQE